MKRFNRKISGMIEITERYETLTDSNRQKK